MEEVVYNVSLIPPRFFTDILRNIGSVLSRSSLRQSCLATISKQQINLPKTWLVFDGHGLFFGLKVQPLVLHYDPAHAWKWESFLWRDEKVERSLNLVRKQKVLGRAERSFLLFNPLFCSFCWLLFLTWVMFLDGTNVHSWLVLIECSCCIVGNIY